MNSIWIKRISSLLGVKSIVTLILAIVFARLSLVGQISSHDFLTVFSVVIAFYFGTQSEKLNELSTETPASKEDTSQTHSNTTKEKSS